MTNLGQAMGQPRRGARHWWQTGPSGLVLRLLRPAKPKTLAAPAPTAAPAAAAKPAPVSVATGAEPQGA